MLRSSTFLRRYDLIICGTNATLLKTFAISPKLAETIIAISLTPKKPKKYENTLYTQNLRKANIFVFSIS